MRNNSAPCGAWMLAVCSFALSGAAWTAPRPFTVAEEIGITDIGDNSYEGKVEAITWSPDRKLIAVHAGRGLLAQNKVESELRIYSVETLGRFARGRESVQPQPLWAIRLATYLEGPIIRDVRWTPDAKGLAFRTPGPDGRLQLVFADLGSQKLLTLSQPGQDVTGFDVHDANHYVYTARDPAAWRAPGAAEDASTVLTGKSLYEVMFPTDKYPQQAQLSDRSELWAARGAAAARVLDAQTGQPIVLFEEGQRSLRLSPDGQWLLTATAVQDVPQSWEQLPAGVSSYRIVAGPQDVASLRGGSRLLHVPVLIELASGAKHTAVNLPTGRAAGWYVAAPPVWSADSRQILLPSQFLPDTGGGKAPCVALFDAGTHEAQCVERLPGLYDAAGERNLKADSVRGLRFADPAGHSIVVDFYTGDGAQGSRQYVRSRTGAWSLASSSVRKLAATTEPGIEVRQSYRDPPTLVVTDPRTRRSGVVWDPNPQLRDVALGSASVLHWKDAQGRDQVGGLYEPADYQAGRRYPLVIQTHGFSEKYFRPSGIFPTALAARSLAAAGIVVLQVQGCSARVTTAEGPCQVGAYEAAVDLLAGQGVVDPERVGIIGFSRTVYYTLEALTRGKLKFAAASVTDGVNEGYWQYLASVDFNGSMIRNEADAMNGGAPFGAGLQSWLSHSPEFNLDKVDAPLLVVGEGPMSLMFMWEPYAVLRYLKKPVELVLLNTTEHVLTTPAVRMASQGGSIDWFRFWLQGYEEPDPAKAEQYKRWEALRAMRKKGAP